MELRIYSDVLRRRKWIIILATLTTLIAAVIGTAKMTPIYQASTTLRIATAAQGSLDSISYAIAYADRLMNTYAKMATSQPVLDQLYQKLHMARTVKITVTPSPNTELMAITVQDPDPTLAANAANLLATLLIEQVRNADIQSDQSTEQMLSKQLVQAESDLNQARQEYQAVASRTPDDKQLLEAANQSIQAKQEAYANLLALYERVRAMQGIRSSPIAVVEPAAVPDSPSWPRPELNFALGLLVGMLSGVGLAFLLENLDTTLYTTEQIQKAAALPILGRIPEHKEKQREVFMNGASPEGEAFRHARTHLLNVAGKDAPRALLITSAEPGEGKSTISSNLAYSFAQYGRRVLIIDCDLRLPSLHNVFDAPNTLGLSQVLLRQADWKEAAQATQVAGVWLIPSGPLPQNPCELLGSARMAALLSEVKEQFDLVLLDGTSILAVADALMLGPIVDAVVIVAGRARISEQAIRSACQLLHDARAKTLGVVVNRAEEGGRYGYYRKTHPARSGESLERDSG